MTTDREALIAATEVLESLRRGHGVEVSTACYPALNLCREALASQPLSGQQSQVARQPQEEQADASQGTGPLAFEAAWQAAGITDHTDAADYRHWMVKGWNAAIRASRAGSRDSMVPAAPQAGKESNHG